MLNKSKEYYRNNRELIRERAKKLLSEDEKEIIREYHRSRHHNMTGEQIQIFKEAKNNHKKDKYHNMNNQVKQKLKDYQKQYRKNMIDEQKQKSKDYQREYQKKYREAKKLNNKVATLA